ncbi:MAG: hypothetical protein H6631_04370 [Anaerolineaceae bacterium]|nr:hypothetical protein [Anaerolineaceae bacterium]
MSETTRDLVQQGLAAARVGDIEDARRLLTLATEQMPDNPEAWLGLAGVVDDLDEKKIYFEKVLELAPDHDEAKASLVLVEQKLAEKREDNAKLGVCYRHPDIETGLRCNRCNRFICTKCAKRTPVGFRCPDCIREQEDKYYSGGNSDYLIAAVIAFPLSLVAAALFIFILGQIGFLFQIIIAIIAAPAAAGFIVEAVRWGVGRRRSRYLRYVVIGSLILGTIATYLILFVLFGGFFGVIAPGMLIFLGSATISTRLR